MRLEQLIQGDDSVQQHVASEREKVALVAVSPMARKAIKQEILPQIEESVLSVEGAEELCEETKRAIEAAFSFKNEIYTRLIQYKTIDQSDDQFCDDLLVVMDEWLRGTKATLRDTDEKTEAAPAKQEVEVTVKVEHAPTESDEVVLQDTEKGPKVEVDPAALFDLGDVRL
jgi:hypothetical protein